MHIFSRTLSVLTRYLTPFYRIALGCIFVLVFSACGRHTTETLIPANTLATQPTRPGSTSITTQGVHQLAGTPTPLPVFPPTPNESIPSALGVTSEELQGTVVHVWHPWSGADGAAFQSILTDFNQHNQWGITVKFSSYEGFGSLDDALDTSLASRGLPDLVVNYGYEARHLDNLDVLLDLQPYINDSAWGWSGEEQTDFYPEFWEEDVIHEENLPTTRRLGVPYFRSAYVLFYNESWANELGYPNPPLSAEDFRAQACAAADSLASQGGQSNAGKGGWLITAQPGGVIGWLRAFGGDITNSTATGYQLNSPKNQQAFEFIKSLQENGCAWSDLPGSAAPEAKPLEEFASRKALFVVGSLFDIAAQDEAFAQAGSTDQWMVIPFPSAEQPVVDAYGPSLLILRSTPVKQLASWLVLEWLVYPPNQSKWVQHLEAYPTRKSTLTYLSEAINDHPQWSQAVKLLPQARSEPSLASWGTMRWVLSDALAGLLEVQLTADQIPLLLENLDTIAAEIVNQVH